MALHRDNCAGAIHGDKAKSRQQEGCHENKWVATLHPDHGRPHNLDSPGFSPAEAHATERLLPTLLAQFQCAQTQEGQNDGNDPEAHDNLRFLPAFFFKVMMQRGHAKDTLACQLEGADLQ